jgi:hypothetical protein
MARDLPGSNDGIDAITNDSSRTGHAKEGIGRARQGKGQKKLEVETHGDCVNDRGSDRRKTLLCDVSQNQLGTVTYMLFVDQQKKQWCRGCVGGQRCFDANPMCLTRLFFLSPNGGGEAGEPSARIDIKKFDACHDMRCRLCIQKGLETTK